MTAAKEIRMKLGLTKALKYAGISRNMWYYESRQRKIEPASCIY